MNEIPVETPRHQCGRDPATEGARASALRPSAVDVETGADGVAVITLALPDHPVNVLTPQMGEDLAQAVEQVLSDDRVVGVVLTSGKSCFMLSADWGVLATELEGGLAPAEAARPFEHNARLMRRIETCGKPFACAINGLALATGMELALACHARMLADDSKALVGLPHVKLGLMPGCGGTQRLPRLIGIERALALLLCDPYVSPRKALELGLVDALGPRERLVDLARAWVLAHRDACQPWDTAGYRLPGEVSAEGASVQLGDTGRCAAHLAIVAAVMEGCQLPMDEAQRLETSHFVQRLADPLTPQRMRAALEFQELAHASAQRTCAAPRLGLIGAGTTGATLAYAAAAAGIDVVLLDNSVELARLGRSHAERVVAREVERQRSSREQADALLSSIRASSDFALLASCDLVIDTLHGERADAPPAQSISAPASFAALGYRLRQDHAPSRQARLSSQRRLSPALVQFA